MASDRSQRISTYDSSWYANYGGCDGVISGSDCKTEKRTAGNNFFPTKITPKQNPFYLDLHYDDLNDRTPFQQRCTVIPWVNDPGYAGHCTDQGFSYMKNRWVQLTGPNGQTCYGQIEDAGPGQYHDASYVFAAQTVRPANLAFGGAGLDVSPALNGCLGFAELDGDQDLVSWRSWTRWPSVRTLACPRDHVRPRQPVVVRPDAFDA